MKSIKDIADMPFQIPDKVSNSERAIFALASLLLLLGLFLNLEVQPVFLEEPRRAIIAMEMMHSGNYIAPTFLGLPYTMKPPLFNWVIILSSKIFANPDFALRAPTVFSLIGICLLLFFISKKYINERFAWYFSLGFACSNGILFYFSLLGEIDLFYSFITLIVFFSIFHHYQQKQFLLLFIAAYFFSALGLLTKGFPSLLFLFFSLPIPFILNKQIKKLFSWQHFIGVFIFSLIVIAYYLLLKENRDPNSMVTGIWSQSSDRTLINKSFVDLFRHLLIFPFETLLNLFPTILLLIFIPLNSKIKKVFGNPLIKYSLILLFVNILVYWISPGTRQRYIYMLYPLIIMPGIWFYISTPQKSKRNQLLKWFNNAFLLILITGAIYMGYVEEFQFIDEINIISISFSIILGLLLIWNNLKKSKHFIILIFAFIIARIAFDLTFLPQRNYEGTARTDKEMATKIYELTADHDLSIYKSGMISKTSIYYLNILRGSPLLKSNELNTKQFYICRNDLLEETGDHTILLDIKYENDVYHLIKLQ